MAKPSGWNKETSPFHKGERALHKRYGLSEKQDKLGRLIIRPFMPDQHRDFYNQLPFMIVGSVDTGGAPWASIIFGRPGFISSPDAVSLTISATPLAGDPLRQNLKAGAPVSFLGIEPPTRRRNRLNAMIDTVSATGFTSRVVQSFGNCPQYIQTRDMEFVRDPGASPEVEIIPFTELDRVLTDRISQADTFFVASHNASDDPEDTGGVDVNHRGGMPGFIRVDGNTLTIPDYRGNNSFNTLGNLVLNPKAGLMFLDYETGDIIQMTGSTELVLDLTDVQKEELSAERAWRFTLDHGHILKNASPLRWAFGEYSPRNPQV